MIIRFFLHNGHPTIYYKFVEVRQRKKGIFKAGTIEFVSIYDGGLSVHSVRDGGLERNKLGYEGFLFGSPGISSDLLRRTRSYVTMESYFLHHLHKTQQGSLSLLLTTPNNRQIFLQRSSTA